MASAAVRLEGQGGFQQAREPQSEQEHSHSDPGVSRKRPGCFPEGLHVLHPPALVGSGFPHPLASPPHSLFGCSHAGGGDMAFYFSYVDLIYFLCYPHLRMFSMDLIF